MSGTRYYTIGGQTVAARTSNGDVQYLAGDQQGTDTLAIDYATLAVTRRYYDPYGNPIGTPPSSWPGTKGFVGGTTDTATGLTNLGAREYNPATGTFISPDSLISPYDPQDLNAYAYATDNPSTDSDPSGQMFCDGGGYCGGGVGSSNGHPTVKSGPAPNPPPSGRGGNGNTDTGTRNNSSAPGSSVLPPRLRPAYQQFLAGFRTSTGQQALKGFFSRLDAFCGNNMSLCGTALTVRILEAYWGRPTVLAGREIFSPQLSLDLLACGGMSFAARTKVLTASGKRVAISKLKIGEKVLATDTQNGKTSAERIARVLVHLDNSRYDLVIRDGPRKAVIVTTSNHLFWDQTTRQWTKAVSLRAGDRLQDMDAGRATVAGGHPAKIRRGWMWDLNIPGDHDFYVAADGLAVLVHNAPPPGCSLITSPDAPMLKTSVNIGPRFSQSPKWRVEIENPNPGSGAANMHFQMEGQGSTKYYYNWETSEWITESGDVLSPRVARQIPDYVVDRALRYFGLDSPDLGGQEPPADEEEPP